MAELERECPHRMRQADCGQCRVITDPVEADARLEEGQWWHLRVAMATMGEDVKQECRERMAILIDKVTRS